MTELKYFLILDGTCEGPQGVPEYGFVSAAVNSTQDMLNNIPLLNALFKFPEDSKITNGRFYQKLSAPQKEDLCYPECGICRHDFIRYYTENPILFEELHNEAEDCENQEVYIFDTFEEVRKFLSDAEWIGISDYEEDPILMPEPIAV